MSLLHHVFFLVVVVVTSWVLYVELHFARLISQPLERLYRNSRGRVSTPCTRVLSALLVLELVAWLALAVLV